MLLLAHLELLDAVIEMVALVLSLSKSKGIETTAHCGGSLTGRRVADLINTLLMTLFDKHAKRTVIMIQDGFRARRDALLLNADSSWIWALLHSFMDGRSGYLLRMRHLLHLRHIHRLEMLVMVSILTLLQHLIHVIHIELIEIEKVLLVELIQVQKLVVMNRFSPHMVILAKSGRQILSTTLRS